MAPDDIILLMSSGPLGGLTEGICSIAEQRFPKSNLDPVRIHKTIL
jgi:hypothetical protein